MVSDVTEALYAVEEDYNADVEISHVDVLYLLSPDPYERKERDGGEDISFQMLGRFAIDAEADVADYANSPRDEGDFVFLLQDRYRFQVERGFPTYATVILQDDTPVGLRHSFVDIPSTIELSVHEIGANAIRRWSEERG